MKNLASKAAAAVILFAFAELVSAKFRLGNYLPPIPTPNDDEELKNPEIC